jgi:hypothetical protein
MVHLDYCLDDGKWVGLLFQETALFRCPTYAPPPTRRACPNATRMQHPPAPGSEQPNWHCTMRRGRAGTKRFGNLHTHTDRFQNLHTHTRTGRVTVEHLSQFIRAFTSASRPARNGRRARADTRPERENAQPDQNYMPPTAAGPTPRPLPRAVLKRYQRAFSTRCTGNQSRLSSPAERGSRDDSAIEDCVAQCSHNATPLRATPVVIPQQTLVWTPRLRHPPRIAASVDEDRYLGTRFPLGGGLNK